MLTKCDQEGPRDLATTGGVSREQRQRILTTLLQRRCPVQVGPVVSGGDVWVQPSPTALHLATPSFQQVLAWQSGRHKSPRPGTTVRSACRVKAPQLSEDPLSQLAHWSGSVQAWLSLSLHVFSQWILHFLHLCFSRLLSMKMKRRVTCICLFLGQWW